MATMSPRHAAEGQDLVVISATVSGKNVEGRFKSSPTPVLLWESNILDEHEHDRQAPGRRLGRGREARANLPLAGQRAASAGRRAAERPAKSFAESVKKINWGKPGLGAAIIATLPGEPAKAVIFGYETGAIMDYDFPAPGAAGDVLFSTTLRSTTSTPPA